MHRALTACISVSKRSTSTSSNTGTQNATSQKAAERLEADTDDNDYYEKTDEANYEEKQDAVDSAIDEDVADNELANESASNQRLEGDHKTEEHESNVDGMKDERESKALKRKEPADDETSPKRQCPQILIE